MQDGRVAVCPPKLPPSDRKDNLLIWKFIIAESAITPMDRFEAMNAFVAVADSKGFAPGARRIGISPSAATRLVNALEAHLGVRLLQRTTRSIALTDAGSRFLVQAQRILSDLSDAESSAQAERAQPIGRFVVSAPSLFGRLHVSHLMCMYLSRYREVVGELLLTDRAVNLVEDGVDLAIHIGQLADSSLVACKVGETRRVIVASPNYLAQYGEPEEPADLIALYNIHVTAISSSTDWVFQRSGKPISVAISPRYVTNSADAAIWHAERDGGITMALAYQVSEHVRDGRLKVILPDYEPPTLPIQLIYPTSRWLSAKVRAFLDLTKEICDWRFCHLG